MATTIKIKRSTGTSAPSSLSAGELAYTGGAGVQGGSGSRLFVGNPADGANLVIGGKYFTDMLDHVLAVFVPCTWSSISVKYLPPITRFAPSAGLPTNSLEPEPPWTPAPPV